MSIIALIDLPISGVKLAAVGVVVFVAAGVVAYLVLRMFIKSVKMAMKFAFVSAIATVVLVGLIAVWSYTSETPKPSAGKPSTTKAR
ncbi:MAG TPA: hypothetical protein PKD24_08265 [Pyrinomonadaceae bacterium]|nr:hypothetical protein [Pyrinomonadaceae bacterium]